MFERVTNAFNALRGLTVSGNADGSGVQNLANTDQRGSLHDPNVPVSQITTWGDTFGIGGQESGAGVSVSPDTAMMVAAVYRAVNIISNSIATLPLYIYRENNKGKNPANDHPVYRMLASEPNRFQTWFVFFQHLISSALLRGNGYAVIVRNKYYEPISLRFVMPQDVSVVYYSYGSTEYLYYYIWGKRYNPEDVIHIACLGSNGIEGKSVITLHREGLGVGMAAEKFGAKFFGSGANMSGVLEHPNKLTDPAKLNLAKVVRETYSGLNNSHKVLVLDEGMQYKGISIKPTDAQFLETRKFQIEEISRMFGVPLHKLQSLDRATNNNIEHQSIEFVTDAIVPWVRLIEQEFNRKLLAEDEKGKYIHEMDVSYLMRGDSKARSEYFKNMFNAAALSPDEIRELEGWNPKGGMSEKQYIQMNMVPLDEKYFTAPDRTNQKDPKDPNDEGKGN